ncbi:hypothetical protein ACFYPT_41505, partial [Streptomyces sp. NPDC005529]|uniref:hypothetical protein n=1 Tax=unclassified Streptomyces TaxID=2593676 RepID=UPI0033AA1C2C
EASLFGTTSSETLIINPTAHPKYLHTQEEWWTITGNLPKATRKYRKYTDNEKHNRAEKGLEAKEGCHFLHLNVSGTETIFEMKAIPREDCSAETSTPFALSLGEEVLIVNPWAQSEFVRPPVTLFQPGRSAWLMGIVKGTLDDSLVVVRDAAGGNHRYRMTVDTWNQMKDEGLEVETGTPGYFMVSERNDARAILGPFRWDDPRLVPEDIWFSWVNSLPPAAILRAGDASNPSVYFLRNGSTNRLFKISWTRYKEPRAGTTECFVVYDGKNHMYPVLETAACIEDYDLDQPDRVVDAVGLDTYLRYLDRAFPGLDTQAVRAEFAGIRGEVEARQAREAAAGNAGVDVPAQVRSCTAVRALEDGRWLVAGACLPGEYAWDNVLVTRLSDSPQIWEGNAWRIAGGERTLYALAPEDPDTQRGWHGWIETLPYRDSIALAAPDNPNTVEDPEGRYLGTDCDTGTSVVLRIPSGPGSLAPDDCIHDANTWFLIKDWSGCWSPARIHRG